MKTHLSRREARLAAMPHASDGRTFGLLVAGLAGLLTVGCGPGGGGPPPTPPVEVTVAEVQTAPVEDRLSAVGTIQSNEQVTVMPEAAGLVQAIYFTEGQRVEAGAPLFELDDRKEKAQLEQAKVDLDLARQNAERVEQLAGTRAISQQEIDQVRSQVTLKEAVLAFAEKRVAEMRIVAPFAGVLGPRAVSLGQFVTTGEPLVTLTDDSRVKVVYEVPERHLARLQTGQKMELSVAAFPERRFPGAVDLISPQVDAATRTVEVRAVAENPDRVLRPGMFARVETITGARPAAVVIEERAIVPSLEGFAVYVVTNEVARLRGIKLGQRMAGRAEVVQGLQPGQKIVVSGLQKIVDGSAVASQPGEAVAAQAGESPADPRS
ncbi:MAG: efflux RND transporter periplasmic adaptor subunit [Verrucomicrobiales bacterium]|nr:efflux RND transporter periplasmic adaptor subunit [Verrucomicrobiales bacterium]MCP5528277.1 efflux RND transporter periplasmic adaptor subunit [Verrucomicrobiales bacterium]